MKAIFQAGGISRIKTIYINRPNRTDKKIEQADKHNITISLEYSIYADEIGTIYNEHDCGGNK